MTQHWYIDLMVLASENEDHSNYYRWVCTNWQSVRCVKIHESRLCEYIYISLMYKYKMK